MKLIKVEEYQIKVADEALLVKPIRRLFNMDRSIGKEHFYKQMSVLFYVYDPRSNYSYITNEEDRLKEVLAQEGISDFKMTAEFKAAVEVYKNLIKTASSELLEDVKLSVSKLREALKAVSYDKFETEKDKVGAINTLTAVLDKLPKVVKSLAEAEKAVAKELEETNNARGGQELSVFETMTD